MKLCVLDCSYAMSWVFDDEKEERADALLAQLKDHDSLVVPAVLWGLEVANCLHGARQRGRLTASQAEEKRKFLEALPVIELVPPHGLSRACFDLSAKSGLTSYDAAYLALAIEEQLPLATNDQALLDVARRAGVEIWGEG